MEETSWSTQQNPQPSALILQLYNHKNLPNCLNR